MPVLTATQLTKSYGDRRGINEVNLELAAGEIFGFLGPNGAGKSTTIRLLLGFLKSDSGTARILGHDCWDHSALIKQQIGYVPGDVRLYPWLTARRAFQIVSGIRGKPLMDAGLQLAEEFHLEPDLPVRKMSRGNRQKVSLVLALVHRPALIILDEPTSGLDPLMQELLIGRLRKLAGEGCAVFFSSHTLGEVETLCDRVAIVRDGRIIADTALPELKERAPRRVELHFQSGDDAAACQLPPGTEGRQQTEATIVTSLTGGSTNLVQWAAQQPLADLCIGPPNLETLFRSYYNTTCQENP